eukprot:8449028-Pyramimonas_sp.AAC.1
MTKRHESITGMTAAQRATYSGSAEGYPDLQRATYSGATYADDADLLTGHADLRRATYAGDADDPSSAFRRRQWSDGLPSKASIRASLDGLDGRGSLTRRLIPLMRMLTQRRRKSSDLGFFSAFRSRQTSAASPPASPRLSQADGQERSLEKVRARKKTKRKNANKRRFI